MKKLWVEFWDPVHNVTRPWLAFVRLVLALLLATYLFACLTTMSLNPVGVIRQRNQEDADDEYLNALGLGRAKMKAEIKAQPDKASEIVLKYIKRRTEALSDRQ